MKNKKHIFVSYTLNDGHLNKETLQRLRVNLIRNATCFVDVLDNDSEDKQARIIQELELADALILIETPMARKSKWVKIELQIALERSIPIKVISPDQIEENLI